MRTKELKQSGKQIKKIKGKISTLKMQLSAYCDDDTAKDHENQIALKQKIILELTTDIRTLKNIKGH